MKKICLVCLLSSLFSYSQSFHGLVEYGEIQSMGMGGAVGPEYNAYLVFNHKESLYVTRQDSLEGGPVREQRTFDTTGGNRSSVTVVTNAIGFRYYNDLEQQQFYSRDLGFSYVKEPIPEIAWDITNERKKLDGHVVYKAHGYFRGRNYTAWFTTDIPLPYGPWKLQGLPGLILEAYDTHQEIYWYFKTLEYPTDKTYLLQPIENMRPWINGKKYAEATIEAWKIAGSAGGMTSGRGIEPGRQKATAGMLRTYMESFEEGAEFPRDNFRNFPFPQIYMRNQK